MSLRVIVKQSQKKGGSEVFLKEINFALIFGAEESYITEILSFLKADALFFSEKLKVNLYGVHYKHLKEEGFSWALLVKENLEVEEVNFTSPLFPEVVWMLHLPREKERYLHQNLSFFFKKSPVLQINPYLSAKRADNKFWTLNLWSSFGLTTPRGIIILRKSSPKEQKDKLEKFLSGITHPLYIQPNKDTEGRDTFRVKYTQEKEIFYLLKNLLLEDDVIIREERGNLFYFKEKERGIRRVAFRINVGYNGNKFIANSGFAEVSLDENSFITSLERGGEIKDINEVLANLYFIKKGRKHHFIPDASEINKIKEIAETSLLVLNSGLSQRDFLKFAGVDILLEVNEKEELVVIPLEINPRPSGLNHSEEIRGISQDKSRRKITSSLFELLQSSVEDHP